MLLLWAATAAVCIGCHRHIYCLNLFSLCVAFAETCFSRENCFFSNLTWVFFSWQSLCAFSLSKDRSFSVHKSGSGFKLVITFSWSWVCGWGRAMAVNILQIHWSNQNFQITGGVIAMTRLVVKKITSFLYGLLIFRYIRYSDIKIYALASPKNVYWTSRRCLAMCSSRKYRDPYHRKFQIGSPTPSRKR